MAADVVNLSEVRALPVADVVVVLEDILERARAGEIRGFAMVAVCAGASDATVFVRGEATLGELLVPLERLKLRMLGVIE